MSRIAKSFFPGWLTKDSSSGKRIAIVTRIRLARNFPDCRFVAAAASEEKHRVLKRAEHFSKLMDQPKLTFQRLESLNEMERGVLVERGLVHPDSARTPQNVGLATSQGQTISLLVNEEDHLRIQVMSEGLNLEQGLETAKRLDGRLGQLYPLATHAAFGFLTASPTNVGTGLRASVMLHLPGLVFTREVVQVLQAVLHMGLGVRGFLGEGAEQQSMFFQISNQRTLGRGEEEIILHLNGVVRQIIDREGEAREKLLKQHRRLLEDKVGRAAGLLTGCKLLGLNEALELISTLRLGVEAGVWEGPSPLELNALMILIQSAHLQLLAEKTLNDEEQQARRAVLVQKQLRLGKKK